MHTPFLPSHYLMPKVADQLEHQRLHAAHALGHIDAAGKAGIAKCA